LNISPSHEIELVDSLAKKQKQNPDIAKKKLRAIYQKKKENCVLPTAGLPRPPNPIHSSYLANTKIRR
jgi:hypothetical protein